MKEVEVVIVPSFGCDTSGKPKETGKVKWFNHSKGFGFITPDAGGKEVFFHFSAVQGINTAKEGDKVQYDLCINEKGTSAGIVHIIK
uniref:CSD domain-containing protein n=1 Tax=Strigamia maritima TaxID=126957 RepID=T1JBT9_STRMM